MAVAEKRRELRWPTGITALCRVPATPMAATFTNISTEGCKGQTTTAELANRGATITFNLTPTDTVAGLIVWRKGNNFGVRFYEPLSEEAVARIALQRANETTV